jgi:hypothetical protein
MKEHMQTGCQELGFEGSKDVSHTMGDILLGNGLFS